MPDAAFVGFQEDGDQKIPLFNILKEGHRLKDSTVSLETLMLEGLKYPPFFKEEYHEHKTEYVHEKCCNRCQRTWWVCVCGEALASVSMLKRPFCLECVENYGGKNNAKSNIA